MAEVQSPPAQTAPAATETETETETALTTSTPTSTDLAPMTTEQTIITTNADSYHLLRFVTGALDGSFFLHLWLARDEGNLALARMRLARIADRMVL